jgi:predicted kinase
VDRTGTVTPGSASFPYDPKRQSAPREKLRDRIQQRAARNQDASDADLAVLEHQLTHQGPLDDQEKARIVTVPALRRGSGFQLIQDI